MAINLNGTTGITTTGLTSNGIDDNSTSTAMTLDSSGNVGIGTSSPSANLDVNSSVNSIQAHFGTSSNRELIISSASSGGYDDALTKFTKNSSVGEFAFLNSGGERMRIDSSGNLLVGGTSAYGTSTFTVGYGGDIKASSANRTAIFNSTASGYNGSIVDFRVADAAVGSIGAKNAQLYIGTGDTALKFLPSSDKIVPADTTNGQGRGSAIDLGQDGTAFKDLYLSGGVYLGGTGSANKLDDYEEGTWTPTLPSGGTVSSTVGSVYTKIGNVVYYQMFMQMSGIPNNSTAFYVGGLPFQPSTSGGRQLHGHSTITYINNVDGSDYGAGLNDTNSRVYWHSKVNGNQLTNSNFTGVTQLILAGFYYTA